MEPIVVIVGFLGAGKTTLLEHLAVTLREAGWHPYVILNDYLNADLEARRIADGIRPDPVKALSGSCICCDGIGELRACVNGVPPREKGITLIEANGTSDAALLLGFLGVGLAGHFLPPVQVSVVDVRNWQKRGPHDALEAEQVRVSSLVLLTHLAGVPEQRVTRVSNDILTVNPWARIVTRVDLDVFLDPELAPIDSTVTDFDHARTHWSACSIDLPDLPVAACIESICDAIPPEILRIKGCTRVGQQPGYTWFERTPDGEIHVRPYSGAPVTGAKLLTVGPGSEPGLLADAVAKSIALAAHSDDGSTRGDRDERAAMNRVTHPR